MDSALEAVVKVQIILSIMGVLMVVVVLLMSGSILWPQPSYIHPDEFFQSTEVVAGDIFNITHLRTWEFHPDMPLRDIALPYLLQAPAFYALRAVQHHPIISNLISWSYAVMVIPRIVLALAGILNYYLVLKLCRCFMISDEVATWYWATSYATWTFLARPFTNTVETLLLSAFIILVLNLTQCCTRIKLSDNVPAQVRWKEHGKLKKQSFALGFVLCIGVFNRPTFGLFAFTPLLWLVDQIVSAKVARTLQGVLVFLTGAGFSLAFTVLAVCNSLYYNPEFTHLLSDLVSISREKFDTTALYFAAREIILGMRIPCINFVRYNLLSSNLAEHGIHPWYNHFLVNLPLLLGPLCLLFFWNLAGLLKSCLKKHPTDVLYAMVVVPVLSLSFFPHQEARFLLPVLPIAVVCVARNRVARWKSFRLLALLFNILGFALFGWIHQGGVTPALAALQTRLKPSHSEPGNLGSHYHIMSYATYMPPRHLLFFSNSSDSASRLDVHDMIGAHNHPPTLKVHMEKLAADCLAEHLNCQYFVLLPATAIRDTEMITGWQWTQEAEFCPHVSMERLPVVEFFGNSSWKDWFQQVLPQLCLKVMSVKI